MARCRNCSKSGLGVRTDAWGVCRACRDAIQDQIDRRLEHVRQALACVRSARDPDFLLTLCDVAIEMVERLLPYEKRRLAEMTPLPSSLLLMLRARKEEVGQRPKAQPLVCRSLPGALVRLHAIEPPPPAGASAEGSLENPWWAWQPAPQGAGPEPSREPVEQTQERRQATRVTVHCFAYLFPGGGPATLENLSSGGVFLRTDRLQQPGGQVRLLASTPFGPARAAGVVKWLCTTEGARGMGLEFTHVSLELLEYLERRLGAPLPIAEPASVPIGL